MNTTFKISLDVHNIESQVSITAFRGDSGYTIIANLIEYGKPFHLSDQCTAFFEGVKADGNYLYNECDIENGKIVYDLKKTTPDGETCQTTAFPGVVKCQFKIIGENGGIISAPKFTIVVEDTVYNEQEIVDSVSEATVFTEMIADLNTKYESGFFKGEKGDKGDRGSDGYTPAKGVDYYTPQERQEIVDELSGSFVQKSENAQVGCKGYQIYKVDTDNNRIVTTYAIPDIMWEVGDRIAFDIGKTYTYGFTIKSLAHKTHDKGYTLIYTNEILPASTAEKGEAMYVWNLDKPKYGDIDIGIDAFAYGENVSAHGKGAAAFNRDTKAEGNYSFAANRGTRAGYGAAAFGKGTEALAAHTFTSGQGTVAKSDYQRVGGKFNVEDTEGKYADIVGGGERDSIRKNIYALDWEGNAHFAGGVVVGDGKKKLATEEYVDDLVGTSEPMLYPVNEDALMRLANIQVDITDRADTFLYFTDPHLCEGDNWKDEFDAYAKNIEETFKRSGASFIVCGGDWIGSGDTSQEACYKLAYANSRMKAITPNFYFVVGNKDTKNLPEQTIGNIVNNGGKNYYYFKHNKNTYFVFDTGSDHDHTTLTDYDREQVQFFVDTVTVLNKERNLGRVFVFAHSGWLLEVDDNLDDYYVVHPLIQELLHINNFDVSEYDPDNYYDDTGMKDWLGGFLCGVFTGHIHEEKDERSGNDNGEPVIIARDQLRSGGTPTFDIVVTHNSDIGYGGANIKIINFGNGSDKHYQGGDY